MPNGPIWTHLYSSYTYPINFSIIPFEEEEDNVLDNVGACECCRGNCKCDCPVSIAPAAAAAETTPVVVVVVVVDNFVCLAMAFLRYSSCFGIASVAFEL